MRLEDLFREARKQGFRIERTTRGHWKVFPPDAEADSFTVSPHPEVLKKTLSVFERAGFVAPRGGGRR